MPRHDDLVAARCDQNLANPPIAGERETARGASGSVSGSGGTCSGLPQRESSSMGLSLAARQQANAMRPPRTQRPAQIGEGERRIGEEHDAEIAKRQGRRNRREW